MNKELNMKFRKTVFALLVLMLFPGISTSSAATIAVNTTADELIPNGNCSLREALTNINNAATTYTDCMPAGAYGISDTINIPAGTYTTATTEYSISNNVSIVGAGAGTTIINGNSLARVFNIGAYTVSISGVTITGGNNGGALYGGGILSYGWLTVTNSIISGNTSNFEGGGIYTNGSALTVINSTISGNTAPKAGGIFNWLSTVTVTNSTISGNTATQGDQAGGIYSYGWLTVTNSTISGNTGYTGGGINSYGIVTVTNSTISGNSAGTGGGIANMNGGGIGHSLTVTNSTISGNSAGTGGGIYSQVSATLSNTIVANQASGADCVGSVTSTGYNLESATSCGFTSTGDRQNADPLLGLLQDNGGPTFTHALLNGSPAINVIPSGVNGCGTTITTDQRGVSRPWPGGGLCDIGSFEVECFRQPSGMVSWWGGDNNALDMVGSNNGTSSGTTYDPLGKVGQAFSFDGVDDYVSVPASSSWAFGTGDFTIEFWTFGTSDDYKRPLINNRKTPASENMWAIEIYGVANKVEFHSGLTIILEATNLLTSSSWNHIAVTRNGGLLSMYVNGVFSGSTANSNNFSEINDLQIGRDIMEGNQLLGRTFQGLMDEVAIFKSALSQAEIQAIYNAGSAGICRSCTPPPSDMVSWWGGNNNALDMVGTNDGTLTGDATFASGLVGQAFSLDGVGAYIDAGIDDAFNFNNGTGDFTIDAWINIAQFSTWDSTIITKATMNPFTGWSFYVYADGRLAFGGAGVWEFSSAAGAITTGSWFHVAVTKSGGTYKLLKNGVEVASASHGNLQTSAASLTIGTDFHGLNQFGDNVDLRFNGLIDEVEIFNRALSADEIGTIYNAGGAGKCAIDRTPADFSFAPVTGVQPNSPQQTSFTISGINYVTPISITGGEYAIGGCGAAFTSAPGTVNNGDIVCVKVTPSMTAGGTASADLTIGTVTSTFSATTLQYYARVTPGPKNYSASLTGAYAAATLPGDIIEAYDHLFNEDLDCNGVQSVTLNGGYNPAFDLQVGWSTLHKLTISGTGSLAVSGIAVK